MANAAPFSYEHPRRCRPFQSPVQNANRLPNKENAFSDSPKTSYIEQSILRLERSLDEKFASLMSRVEKCSDLSIASSRAVAVLSQQLDELRCEQDERFADMSKSISDLRVSTTRLCSESQHLTMTAIEDCCGELMKKMQTGTACLEKLQSEVSSVQQQCGDGLDALVDDLRIQKVSMDLMLKEVNGRFDHQAEIVYDEIENRVKALAADVEEANKKQEAYTEENFLHLLTTVDERISRLRVGETLEFQQSAMDKISIDFAQIKAALNTFSIESIPAIYHDVDTHVAQFEYKLRQMVCDLMKDLCLEVDTDISRTIELIHSVFVQSGIPMPPGTRTSWRKFRKIIFQKETVGNQTFMRPILPTKSPKLN